VNRIYGMLGSVLMLHFSALSQCDSIPVVMDSQGGFNYQWCAEDWNGQEPDCVDLDCNLFNPCVYQTVCFTLEATSTLPYIFTMDSELSNIWTDGVSCKFYLANEDCTDIYIAPCFGDWNLGQDEIVVDYWDGWEGSTPNPTTCCSGSDWTLTVWLPIGEVFNFCVVPAIHPDNEGGGCMDLTIFSPGLLGLSIEEYKNTGYWIDRGTRVKLDWLGW